MHRMAMLLLLVGASCADDPSGNWSFETAASERLVLDVATISVAGTATVVFVVPVPDSGAFYRLTARFNRAGTASTTTERAFLRSTPRYETFDGVKEATTILAASDPEPEAELTLRGNLEPCELGSDCIRVVDLSLGWLSQPEAGATMGVVVDLFVELRGPGEQAPADIAAVANLQF